MSRENKLIIYTVPFQFIKHGLSCVNFFRVAIINGSFGNVLKKYFNFIIANKLLFNLQPHSQNSKYQRTPLSDTFLAVFTLQSMNAFL